MVFPVRRFFSSQKPLKIIWNSQIWNTLKLFDGLYQSAFLTVDVKNITFLTVDGYILGLLTAACLPHWDPLISQSLIDINYWLSGIIFFYTLLQERIHFCLVCCKLGVHRIIQNDWNGWKIINRVKGSPQVFPPLLLTSYGGRQVD